MADVTLDDPRDSSAAAHQLLAGAEVALGGSELRVWYHTGYDLVCIEQAGEARVYVPLDECEALGRLLVAVGKIGMGKVETARR